MTRTPTKAELRASVAEARALQEELASAKDRGNALEALRRAVEGSLAAAGVGTIGGGSSAGMQWTEPESSERMHLPTDTALGGRLHTPSTGTPYASYQHKRTQSQRNQELASVMML